MSWRQLPGGAIAAGLLYELLQTFGGYYVGHTLKHPDNVNGTFGFVIGLLKIGRLEDVYIDVETDEPMFGTVNEGLIGRHLTFVPLAGITIGPDNLQVPVSKDQVKSAPNIELHGDELSTGDESTLYHHYQLNYTPPDTERGRRLARR